MIDSKEEFFRLLEMADRFYNEKEYKKKKRSESPVQETMSRKTEIQTDSLENISQEVNNCRKCKLSVTRNFAVPGEGVIKPKMMIIGEAPGADEDKQGRPFVGKAGQYLDKWLAAIELSRDRDVFIANILKCRPPGNRDPLPEECDICSPYLYRQLELLRPKVILTLGRISTQYLLKTQTAISRMRGKVYYFMNIPLVPTFHPAAVLRNPEYRKDVWEDLKLAREQL